MTNNARLDRPELARLWDELARRYGDGTEPVTVTLRDLDDDERAAIADLLALDRRPGSACRLRVDRIAAGAGVDDLRALVEQLRGPLPDRRAARDADRSARDALWRWLAEATTELPLPWPPGSHGAWLDAVRGGGVPSGDVAASLASLEGVVAVLRSLPADGIPLATFARDLLGDPHALDHGRRAARTVLAAVAALLAVEPALDAESSRQLWEGVGVSPDPLSSTVLALGLRSPTDDPLSRWLNDATDAGEAAVVTLAQLRRWPRTALSSGAFVHVVENPSIVAEAARRWRSGSRPLVCSSGRPSVAVVTLLRQLGAHGATLRQHADFDAAGVGITAWLAARAGTEPWRMSADDYLEGLTSATVPLKATIAPTPWDPRLAEAMCGAGRAVHEEDVRDRLLDDILA